MRQRLFICGRQEPEAVKMRIQLCWGMHLPARNNTVEEEELPTLWQPLRREGVERRKRR